MLNPQQTAWLDQEDAMVATYVRQYGLHISYVSGECDCGCSDANGEPDGTIFAYTTGLLGLSHPELLIFNVTRETAAGALNDLAARVKAGHNFMVGELVEFDAWPHRITCEEVPNPGNIVFGANRFYQRSVEASVPVLQLTYDDVKGNFPWDPGYLNDPWIQPRPGTFHA